jgi:hypothetical protein
MGHITVVGESRRRRVGRGHGLRAGLAVAAGLALVPIVGAVTAGPAVATAGAPTVTAVSPNSGPSSGGTAVTITGTHFQGPVWSVDTACDPTSPNATGASGACVEDATAVGPTGSMSTVHYPQLRPAGAGELYVGYAAALETPQMCGGTPGAACTSDGYTFNVTQNTNELAFDPDTTAALQAPTDSLRPAGPAAAVAVLLGATTGPIQAVGSPQDSPPYNGVGYSPTQLPVTSQGVGDLVVVVAHSKDPSSSVTSVSGGGVGTWHKAVQYQAASGDTSDNELWWGVVSNPGTAAVSFAWNVSAASTLFEYVAQEFTAPDVGYDATSVTFGGTPATFTVQSPTEIRATAPAGTVGPVHVQVSNSNGTSPTTSADEFTYERSFAITTTSLPDGTIGQRYTGSIKALGGTAPLTWVMGAGQLPWGLALDASTGAITGSPVWPGTWHFTVKALDSSSPQQQATRALSITVHPWTPGAGGFRGFFRCSPRWSICSGVGADRSSGLAVAGNGGWEPRG